MTFNFAKTLVACVALSSVCFASTAFAGNGFNKFPTQTAAPTAQPVHVTTYTVVKTPEANTVTTKRKVNRVVEPVTTHASYDSGNQPATTDNRFNKMVAKETHRTCAMPVLNKRAVLIR